MRRDSFIEGRVSRSLGSRISLASTGRYRWREMAGDAAADTEIAFGRFGLVCKLPDQVRLDIASVVRQEVGVDLVRGAGPSVGVVLPLGDTIDVSANYDLTQRVRYDAADSQSNGRTQNLHHLGVGMTWDVGSDASDIKMSTAYRYEHVGAEAGGQGDARHTGTVSFALDF